MKNENYNPKKSNAYHALHQYCKNIEIMKMMQRFGYKDDIFLVMKGEVETLRKDFPETWKNICSCKRKADSRTPLEFARDIVSAWVIEDMIKEMLMSEEIKVSLNGGDANRQILAENDVTPDSDFKVTYNGVTRKIELSNDYSSFVIRNKYNDLRGNKLSSLENEKAILLIVNLEQEVFAMIDTTKPFRADRDVYNRAYGKLCSKIYIDKFYPLSALKDITKNLLSEKTKKSS